jgi:Protein of unknown function (DUF4199)
MMSDEQLSSPNPPSAPYLPLATRTGFIIAAITVGIALVAYVLGMTETMMVNPTAKIFNNLIAFLLPFVIIVYTCFKHRNDDLGGYIGLGRCIGLGTAAGIVSGLISAIWAYAFFAFLAPEMIDAIKSMSIQEAAKAGQDADMVEEQLETVAFMFKPWVFGVVSFGTYLFIGFFGGLLSGMIFQKERPYM